MKKSAPIAKGIALGVAITLVLGLGIAVLLSNVSEFRGPLAGGVLTVSEITSGGGIGQEVVVGAGGVLSFTNNTTKPFHFTVTNEVNRTVGYNLTLSFFLHGVVNGGFEVLHFEWSVSAISIGTVVLDPTNEQGGGQTPSWFDRVPDTLAPFASYLYTVEVHFAWVGAGDFTFRAWAADGST